MLENKHTEFKQKVTPELEREVVAFLNSNEGGIIYIGVNDKGIVRGIENTDQEQLIIKDRLKNNILPSCLGLFDLVIESIVEKKVIKIIVARGYEKPYYIKKYGLSEKGTFIRIGSATEPMPLRQIENLFSKRTRNSLGKIASPKQNLQFQQLHIYYQSTEKVLNEQFARNLELLTEEGIYNYVAYLMSDINSISIKVARYNGVDRVELAESNEYGYESLIKATKQVLDKLNLENKTLTKITSKEREEKRLWNSIALREAVINAFVHNDYTREIAPKFEIFDDRLEITSYGSLPDGLSQDEFFEGFSVPRNKELIRIFKDLDLVEQLGSGIPRILKAYSQDSFQFSENFLRITMFSLESISFTEQVVVHTEQDTEQAVRHTEQDIEQAVRYTEQASEQAVEHTEQASEQAVEHTEQDTEQVVEHTEQASEQAVEHTEQASEQAVEHTEQDTEQVVEHTEQAVRHTEQDIEQAVRHTEQAVGQTEQDIEQVVEQTEQDIEQAVGQTEQDIEQVVEHTEQDIEQVVEHTEQDIEQVVEHTEQDIEQVEGQTEQDTEQVVEQTEQDIEQAVEHTEHATEQTVRQTEQATEQAVGQTEQDIEQVVEQTEQDIEQVVVHTEHATEQVVEHIEHATEQVVEQTEQDTEQVVEQTEQDIEQVVEQTEQATEQVVEQTEQATEQVVEQTEQATEQVVEQTEQATEQVVVQTEQDTEQVAEYITEQDSEQVVGQTEQDSEQVAGQTEQDNEQVAGQTEQATEQVLHLISIMKDSFYSGAELMVAVSIRHRPTFLYNYLQPAITAGYVELTIPDKPTSGNQKYYLTEKGIDKAKEMKE